MRSIFLHAKHVACAGLAAAIMIATPASANSAAAASVDITQSVKDTGSALGNGDEHFHELFASWKSQDASKGSISGTTSVSVPSRAPLIDSRVSSPFGYRNHPISGGRKMHDGIDLAAPSGTPIYAPADGVVERANRFSGYGNYIAIDHGGSLETRYGHLSAFAVHAGDHVTKGQVIGYVGSTGHSTGPHLHYEVRIDGTPVNPAPYLALGDARTEVLMANNPTADQHDAKANVEVDED